MFLTSAWVASAREVTKMGGEQKKVKKHYHKVLSVSFENVDYVSLHFSPFVCKCPIKTSRQPRQKAITAVYRAITVLKLDVV